MILRFTSQGISLFLCLLFILLQYQLWFASGGLRELIRLNKIIAVTDIQNARLAERNNLLAADVKDLRQGDEAVEERARSVLGMVKSGEIFFQVVE